MDLNRKKPRIFYGWIIVGAAVIIVLYTGGIVHFGFTAVFEPIAKEFGWSYAQVSLAFSLRGFEMGLLAPIVGLLVDKWGPRKMIFGGAILICIGFLVLSQVNSIGMFYGAFVFIATGMSTCSGTVLMTAVANWFRRNAGIASGIVASGFGLGGLIVPLITWLIDIMEWRAAMVTVGLGMLVFVLPLAFVVRHKPEHYGYLPDGDTERVLENGEVESPNLDEEVNVSIKEAIKGRTFWHIAISSACHSFTIGAMVTHMMPYLSSVGIARSLSSMAALILPVASIAGRLTSGWMANKFGSRTIFSISFLLMMIGTLFFAFVTDETKWLLIPFVVALSLGWGWSVITRITMLRDYYGRSSFGAILGSTSGIMMIGNMSGAPIAGLVYDNWGSYQGAWLSFAGVALLGAILVFTSPPLKGSAQLSMERQAERLKNRS
ncbi:MFS transporter [Chloroflexota bacterium]